MPPRGNFCRPPNSDGNAVPAQRYGRASIPMNPAVDPGSHRRYKGIEGLIGNHMAKPLLILALVATQLVSWSSPALYLCVCGNGSVCVDAGPSICTCCEESDEAAGRERACACACHGDVQVCESGEFDDPRQVVSDVCRCRHIQISLEQAPTVSVLSVSTVVERLASLMALLPYDLSPVQEVQALFDQRTRIGQSPVPSPLLIALASVVLQC